MACRVLADVVVLLHLLFILFMLLGGLAALRWRWFPWIHLPAALWGVYLEISGRVCPLTPLEIWLRQKGGSSGYEGGFVEHYLLPIIYPAALTREVQLLLGIGLLGVNIVVYAIVRRLAIRRRAL
jgi:hypothetical protein